MKNNDIIHYPPLLRPRYLAIPPIKATYLRALLTDPLHPNLQHRFSHLRQTLIAVFSPKVLTRLLHILSRDYPSTDETVDSVGTIIPYLYPEDETPSATGDPTLACLLRDMLIRYTPRKDELCLLQKHAIPPANRRARRQALRIDPTTDTLLHQTFYELHHTPDRHVTLTLHHAHGQETDKLAFNHGLDNLISPANLADIQTISSGSATMCRLRSARTTSPYKVLSLLLGHALRSYALLPEKDKQSLSFTPPQLCMVSLLDTYPMTGPLGGPSADEKKMIRQIQIAIQILYPHQQHTLTYTVDNVHYTIRKPLFAVTPFNRGMTTLLGLSTGIQKNGARYISRPTYVHYLRLLTRKAPFITMSALTSLSAQLTANPHDPSISSSQLFVVFEIMLTTQPTLTVQQTIMLQALQLVLSGAIMFNGTKRHFASPKTAPIERLLLHTLEKYLGIVTAFQCKSGMDRSGLATAFATALDHFEKETSRPYALHLDGLPFDHLRLRGLFTIATDSLCLRAHKLTHANTASFKAYRHDFLKAMYLTNPSTRRLLGLRPTSPLLSPL